MRHRYLVNFLLSELICALQTYHWLSSEDSVETTAPCGGGEHLNSSDVVVGGLGIDTSKGNSRSDGGKEDEDGDSNCCLVKVGEFLAPPSSNGSLPFSDDRSSTVSVLLIVVDGDPRRTDVVLVTSVSVGLLDGCFFGRHDTTLLVDVFVREKERTSVR